MERKARLRIAGALLGLSLLTGGVAGAAETCGSRLDKIARVGSLDLAYRQYGPRGGPPMVLIGGTGQQLIDWPRPLIDAMTAKGYRLTVFDNRDVGCSTHLTQAGPPPYAAILSAMAAGAPPPVAYSLQDMAEDTRGLMDALHIPRAHIVGVSGGAIVAEMFAAKYPARTLSLSAIAANSGNKAYPIPADAKRLAGLPPEPAVGAAREAVVAYQLATRKALASLTYPKPDLALRALIVADLDRGFEPVGLARHSAAALVTPDLRDRLRTIAVPTVVIQGDEDPLIPRALAQDVADTVPGARLVVLEGMGHDLPDALAPQFAAAIGSVANGR